MDGYVVNRGECLGELKLMNSIFDSGDFKIDLEFDKVLDDLPYDTFKPLTNVTFTSAAGASTTHDVTSITQSGMTYTIQLDEASKPEDGVYDIVLDFYFGLRYEDMVFTAVGGTNGSEIYVYPEMEITLAS